MWNEWKQKCAKSTFRVTIFVNFSRKKKKKSHKFLKNNFLRNVYFKFLVMLHILFLDITEHEWFSRSYYPTLEMNKIKENRLVVFPLMTIFQFFFLQMSWFTKKKSSKPFLMNWTRLLLKCLATKKPSSSQLSPSSPLNFPIPIKNFFVKSFSRKIYTIFPYTLLRYFYYPPPKTAHLIFHIL